MIWSYSLTKTRALQTTDAYSLTEVEKLAKSTSWLWVDVMDPDDKELEVIAGLLKEEKIINAIRKKQTFSHREKINDFVLLYVPQVVYNNTVGIHPIYIFAKTNFLLTVRSRHARAHNTSSSFVINRLLHEVSDENLEAVMLLRTRTDKLEELALDHPGDKEIVKKSLRPEAGNLCSATKFVDSKRVDAYHRGRCNPNYPVL